MSNKCARPSCKRKEQNAGLCKHHYRLATRGMPTGRVSPEPVILHIKALAEAGVSNSRVGQLCGIPQNNIWAIVNGRRSYLFASTAAKILSVPIPDVPWKVTREGANTPLIGSQRRLRALMAIGYTGEMLADRIGVDRRVITKVAGGSQRYITAGVARAIAELFNELQLTRGPSEISRRRALSRGWLPPLAWDEDEIDNPAAVADELKSRRTTTLERYEELRYLGLSDEEIAGHLHVSRDYIRHKIAVKAS